MLKSREKLNDRIVLLISRLEERRPLYDELNEKYNIPISLTADICTNREDISSVGDFIAFAMLDGLSQNEVKKYFTEEEIKVFSKQKLAHEEFELPLVFNDMVQVAPDQWIGKISARELMRLKDAQIIKYNENTQRTMRRIIHGEDRYYRIALNNKSVTEIKESLSNGSYIPDDITLNMPFESTEFAYSNGKITITELDMLDILDGYHRYIAISRLITEDKNFDYPMELRLVSFSEEKAKQFIYQKDQKTKMRQVDSNALNQYSPANIIVNQLNTEPSSNIQGMIGRNGGNINLTELSAMIDYYWFRGVGKVSRKDILVVKKEIQDKFNAFISSDLKWADHVFTVKEIAAIMYCFKYEDDYLNSINKLFNVIDNMPSELFTLPNGKVRRKLINEFKNML